MKTVPFVTKDGEFNLIVDDIDYWSILAIFKTTGYRTTTGEVKVCINTQNQSLSNWLLGKPPHGFVIDHINRDKLDFRRENLRVVTHVINVKNRGLFKNNRAGMKGVYWKNGKYEVQLCVAENRYYGGRFDDVKEAGYAFDTLVRKHSPDTTTNEALGLLPSKPLVAATPVATK